SSGCTGRWRETAILRNRRFHAEVPRDAVQTGASRSFQRADSPTAVGDPDRGAAGCGAAQVVVNRRAELGVGREELAGAVPRLRRVDAEQAGGGRRGGGGGAPPPPRGPSPRAPGGFEDPTCAAL